MHAHICIRIQSTTLPYTVPLQIACIHGCSMSNPMCPAMCLWTTRTLRLLRELASAEACDAPMPYVQAAKHCSKRTKSSRHEYVSSRGHRT